jgi:hypothetical protein
MIPKKKVKGNEASVWGEMEVLKGLDHPNIVRRIMGETPETGSYLCSGQVLRMVRVSLEVLPII